MNKKTKYTNHPVKGKIIDDFLPKPEDLILKDDTVKITLSINQSSLAFFKKFAKKHHTQYQKMIRNLLDHYVKTCQAHEKTRTKD
jgi:predicted DNA binding CopG/RHH family protein